MTMGEPIEIANVTKRFGSQIALSTILAVAKSGLVSPDGAGKTTLIRLMTRTARPR
ncbi:MAG: hypothetical protein SGJ17_01930 [Hyphomicrobiales bacterium]|nr:hypothetical protein [Hyphomicrobiales bacterium]